MVHDLLPGEAPLFRGNSAAVIVTTHRILNSGPGGIQQACYVNDVALVEVHRNEYRGFKTWGVILLSLGLMAIALSVFARSFAAGTLQLAAWLLTLAGGLLLLSWYAGRRTAVSFKTAAGAISVALTGDTTEAAEEIVKAFRLSRAGTRTPPTAAPPSPSASAP